MTKRTHEDNPLDAEYTPEPGTEQPQREPVAKPNGKHKQSALLRDFEASEFSQIAMRQWEHAGHYIRKNVVMTVAPGAYGKTSLVLLNAIEMALGRGLIGKPPAKRLRVLYWNGEDPDDEILRRIGAICLRYDIDQHDLVGWLHLGGKLKMEQRLASLDRNQQLVINTEVLMEIERYIGERAIDCVIFDPLVAFHRVREGFNELMEQMIQTAFGGLAERRNCCIELCQHTRKSMAGATGELGVDDSRGGSSITNAARSVRVLNRMSREEAKLPSISDDDRSQYLRVQRGKANMLPAAKSTWIKLASQQLPNGPNGGPGDNVQVVEAWDYPQPFDGVTTDDMRWLREECRRKEYLKSARSPERWIGAPLAQRLRLNIAKESDRKRVATILKAWFDNGVLSVIKKKDETRHEREYVVPGDWNEEPDDASIPF